MIRIDIYILYYKCDSVGVLVGGDLDCVKYEANKFIKYLKTTEDLKSDRFVDNKVVENLTEEMILSLSIIKVNDKEELCKIVTVEGYLNEYLEKAKPINLIESILERENLIPVNLV